MDWKPVRAERSMTVPLPRDAVWRMISDTDHLNRFVGLFRIASQRLSGRGGSAQRELRAKIGPLPIAWTESPFEWQAERSYAVARDYTTGPLRRFYGGVELTDGDAGVGTHIRLFAEFTPANALGLLSIPFKGIATMNRTLRYVEEYIKLADSGKAGRLPQAKSSFDADARLLDRLLAELARRPVEQALLPMLREHMLTQEDNDVVGIRPYEWSERWGTERDAALRLFLHATHVGVTNLSWHILCPNCRVPAARTDSMARFANAYHCEFCGIDIETGLDKHVELCFSVHPRIRKAFKQMYCVGGPAISPHVIAQTNIPPGEARTIAVPAGANGLRLRVLRLGHRLEIEPAADAAATEEVVYAAGGWKAERLTLPGGGADIRLRNAGGEDITVVLERQAWEDRCVTAAAVTTMHEFRGMFSSEVLAPGQQVGVENVALLFTDLLASTAFYEHVGDAHAYGQVRKHFDFLRHHVQANAGSVVKTIGDAVMAVFDAPEKAVRAALDIQTHLEAFNASLLPADRMTIKLGVHAGPAIAVNSNEVLDYFGRTVNIAARIQSYSSGGDLVLAEQTAALEAVEAMLRGAAAAPEFFVATLKGIGDMPLRRYRIRSGA